MLFLNVVMMKEKWWLALDHVSTDPHLSFCVFLSVVLWVWSFRPCSKRRTCWSPFLSLLSPFPPDPSSQRLELIPSPAGLSIFQSGEGFLYSFPDTLPSTVHVHGATIATKERRRSAHVTKSGAVFSPGVLVFFPLQFILSIFYSSFSCNLSGSRAARSKSWKCIIFFFFFSFISFPLFVVSDTHSRRNTTAGEIRNADTNTLHSHIHSHGVFGETRSEMDERGSCDLPMFFFPPGESGRECSHRWLLFFSPRPSLSFSPRFHVVGVSLLCVP